MLFGNHAFSSAKLVSDFAESHPPKAIFVMVPGSLLITFRKRHPKVFINTSVYYILPITFSDVPQCCFPIVKVTFSDVAK